MADDDDDHPVFNDIRRGDVKAVKARVLADAAVLDETGSLIFLQMTPLMYAIYDRKPDIALWLIEHRGQQSLETRDPMIGKSAVEWACSSGLLEVVQALVAAGAAYVGPHASAPLRIAALCGQADILAFLLGLPAVMSSINAIHTSDAGQSTALSIASGRGHQSSVQLLLDAGADPTVPAGEYSALDKAIRHGHIAIAALLRRAIAEADRGR